MSQDFPGVAVATASETIDRSRRQLVTSAAGLVLTTSVGALRAGDALAASANETGQTVQPCVNPDTLVATIGAGTPALLPAWPARGRAHRPTATDSVAPVGKAVPATWGSGASGGAARAAR